jgi:hypothetical protein
MHQHGGVLNDIVRSCGSNQPASVAQKGWIVIPEQFIEGRSVPALSQEHELNLVHGDTSLFKEINL